MNTKQNKLTQHLAYFFLSSSFHFYVTTNKNNHKSLYIVCSTLTQHNYQTSCLLRSIIFMIHPDKIKPYSQLHVSMTSLTIFFTSVPMHCPYLFFLSFIGCQAMTTEFYSLPLCRGLFSSPLIGHPDTWLIINSHC